MPSINTVLAEAAKSLQAVSDSALLDAEVMLCMVLGKERSFLRAWPDQELDPGHVDAYKAMLNERQQGKPIAYITGNREFWSRDFLVNPDVLIPRPETELLVELSLGLIPKDEPYKILELGTGSGIIAITLAAERPLAKVMATDISSSALKIAQSNSGRHHLKNIEFFQSHWFDNIPHGKFSLILSNPPYLAEDDPHLNEGDLRFEPKTALIAKEEGLADIRAIAKIAFTRLKQSGYLMVEHGYNQGLAIRNLFINLGYSYVQTFEDLAGLPRVTMGQYQ